MMNNSSVAPASGLSKEAIENDATTVFGFWVYLMTDFVLFASLFAVYSVLRSNTVTGPSGAQIFSGTFVLIETMLLLTSSFTCGLALLAARAGKKGVVIVRLLVTAALGTAFVVMEGSEFISLIEKGSGPQVSAFLSSYFVLVGTHGLHIVIGLTWLVALVVAIAYKGLTRSTMRKLVLWSFFWHFLDIIWIFIFTMVYLFSLV